MIKQSLTWRTKALAVGIMLYIRRHAFTLALAPFAVATLAHADAATDANIPKEKQTLAGQYMTAEQAYATVTANRDKVLFLDIRTVPELMFVGMTNEIDAVVPYMTLPSPPVWDDKAQRYKLKPNPSFVADVEAALAAKGLDKDAMVLLMCRSGSRTVHGVNALYKAGFKNVVNVYDGFEGDMSKDGRRDVNGWKNAQLPWTYKLDKRKAIPVEAQ